jgi:HNH endonuclease
MPYKDPEKLREYRARYYQENREKFREHYQTNRDKMLAENKQWRENNHERRREYMAAYYEANRDTLLAQKKQYTEANRDRINIYLKQWQKANRDKLLPHRAIWETHFKVKIPDGFVIHHKDGNHSNNDLHNLLCCQQDVHATVHNLARTEKDHARI